MTEATLFAEGEEIPFLNAPKVLLKKLLLFDKTSKQIYMASVQITISGKLSLTIAKNLMPEYKIELWDSNSENGYGWISSTLTDINGNFLFLINPPLADKISTGYLLLKYKIYKKNIFISEHAISKFSDFIEAVVVDEILDTTIVDNTADTTIVPYINIDGCVYDSNIALLDNTDIIINVYENSFRTKYLLASVPLLWGKYKVKINTKLINNSDVLVGRSIRIEANKKNGELLAVSGDISVFTESITVNLITQKKRDSSEFDSFSNQIQTVIGSEVLISSLVVDPDNNIDEVKYVAIATGNDRDAIQTIVYAYKLGLATSLQSDFFYALFKTGRKDVNSFLFMPMHEMREAITAAVEKNIIQEFEEREVDDFISGIQAYQLEQIKTFSVLGEDYVLNDVLSSIFSTSEDIDNFLAEYGKNYNSREDFWNAYKEKVGPELNDLAQLGLKLAAITCFQPQIMKELITLLNENNIKMLATWDIEAWQGVISDVCNKYEELCVPAMIRGTATDPGDTYIQQQYANRLMGITQAMFPMGYIQGKLKGNDGSLLIPDLRIRTEVIDFIQRYPDFDLRVKTVNSINATDFDLSGITKDPAELIEALSPFQRILRVVGGNPVAVCNMIIDGIDSAYAISSMGAETFVGTYGNLFPVPVSQDAKLPELHYLTGLAPVLQVVYSTAVTIATTTKSGLTNAITAAIASNSLPQPASEEESMFMAIEGENSIPEASLMSSFSTVPSPYAIPAIPPVFPGGYTFSPLDNPTLSALFGSLDYCACCDCMSVYSPAAYFTDILQFLKTNALSVYSALILRRRDLIGIDLTCQNTDTPMPYIDLAIEQMELKILKASVALPSAEFSFQTTGTAEQLAAYPEHTYKVIPTTGSDYYADFTAYIDPISGTNAYDLIYNSSNLAGAIYPASLPFSLPIEEARTYLKHLGISRFELMKLLLPFNQVPVVSPNLPPTDKITNFALYAEWLGLSQFSAIIVTGAYSYISAHLWAFYGAPWSDLYPPNLVFQDPNGVGIIPSTGGSPGIPWTDVICSRIDLLIQQTAITYDELLQYLTTSYLNPFGTTTRKAYIIARAGFPVDTCKLDQLELHFPNSADVLPFFQKFHRFIRLVKTGKFSIYQWDILLRSMNITDIDTDNFQQIGKLLLIADALNIAPEIICMWFNSADNVEYLNYPGGSADSLPTVYGRIFNNTSTINNAYGNIFLTPASFTSTEYTDYTGQIASFCGIKESELISLLNFLSIPLTTHISLNILSRLYVIAQITKAKGYTISGFINAIKLIAPGTPSPIIIQANLPAGGSLNNYLNNLQDLNDKLNAMDISSFSVAEYSYLIADNDLDNVGPSDSTIQLFYESIRTELQKNNLFSTSTIPVTQPELLTTLTGIIYQHFSKEFNISLQWITDIFSVANNSSVASGNNILGYLLNNDFVKSTYALTTFNISYIESLPVPVPPAISYVPKPPAAEANTDKIPSFRLHLLYNWYKYCYKVAFISRRLKLRTAEFEYLYLPLLTTGSIPVTTVGFNFAQLPVCFVPGSTTILGTYADTAVTVSIPDALGGLLRVCRITDVSNQLSLPENGMGKILDAVSGIIRSTTPGILPTLVGAGDYANANVCFTNLLSALMQDSWGTMLYELIGDLVPSFIGYTVYIHATPVVDGLLESYFMLGSGSNSDFRATSYTNISNLVRVVEIIQWAKRIGLTPSTLHALLVEDITPENSKNLIVASKGKYDDASWAKIAQPLRDPIRAKQRGALIAYLRTSPSIIFGNMLIDVEMDTCMITSRIKQAISSVQLFVDRVLLGLEGSLALTGSTLTQWEEWRKWYSVWEANRKIFFYPEDWLEPELRDDKSIFFKELETELKQDDVTLDKVQDAMMGYLEKLADVARLESVGICEDVNTGKTHAFGRTTDGTNKYYHRTLKNEIWSEWEPMDIGISGNNIVPFVWNNRLRIYWLSFIVKQVPVPESIAAVKVRNPVGGDEAQIFLNNRYFYNT